MTVIFEVRVPTYNRPGLLRRALESLQAQTYPHWVATVYDDATSGADVVNSVGDARIQYSRNPQRLGALGNTDRCFLSVPADGGHYGCFLEDDNFLLPEFFSRVAVELDKKAWTLIQVNQRIWSQSRGLHPETETTRGDWFLPGVVEPIQLRAAAMFVDGLSNGGVIWKLDKTINLQVGPSMQFFAMQETCRSLLVRSPFLFIDAPLAVFNFMPKAETARSNDDNRAFGRGQLSIRRFILKRSGPEIIKLVLAERPTIKNRLFQVVAHSGYPQLIPRRELAPMNALKSYLKGLALRLIRPDPCKDFLVELEKNDVLDFGIGPQLPEIEAQRFPETRRKYRSLFG